MLSSREAAKLVWAATDPACTGFGPMECAPDAHKVLRLSGVKVNQHRIKAPGSSLVVCIYRQSGIVRRLVKQFLHSCPIAEIFIAPRRIKLSTSMASPFPGTDAVIKVEDEENDSGVAGLVSTDQELRKKFREDVQLLVKLKRRLRASGSAQPLPPPVQPSPPPPPPPPPPAVHHPWAKRPAIAPPPGFAGVRQPPLKQYQRKPRAPAPAQPQQPAAPNAHRTPGPPPVNAQSAWRSPQPAPNARRALVPSAPPPAHAGPGGMPPPLQRRSAPKPRHPAAKKKPTVPCAVCGVLCMTAWHLEQHENGRKHQNKLACLAGEMNVQCQVCDVHLSGALNVEEHYAGKMHIWRLKLAGRGA